MLYRMVDSQNSLQIWWQLHKLLTTSVVGPVGFVRVMLFVWLRVDVSGGSLHSRASGSEDNSSSDPEDNLTRLAHAALPAVSRISELESDSAESELQQLLATKSSLASHWHELRPTR